MLKKIFAQSATLRLAYLSCATAIGMQSPLFCQRVKWKISGTTEGLWNITDGKTGWCNLLEVSAETGLWKDAQLETSAISTYNLGIPVAGDLQAFSCIDAGPDKAFRLIEAGIRQNIGDKGSVYAGPLYDPIHSSFHQRLARKLPHLVGQLPVSHLSFGSPLPAHGILPLVRSHLSRKPLQRRGQRPYQSSVPFLPP